MATKKVKLFIVEGPSEETAFALIFQRLFSNDSVWFDVVHGDITTNLNGKPARDALRDQVIEYVTKQQAYNWTDVVEIVHIVDIDGAFVPSCACRRVKELIAVNLFDKVIRWMQAALTYGGLKL
jgi:hypothetical protein